MIVIWANALSLRFCCDTRLNITSLRVCVMREFAIIAYLLHHKTQHYVVKWLYYEWMRYYGVFAATQDSALRRNVTVSRANALSLRICCNTRLNITSLSNCIMSECAIMAYLRQHRTRHYVVTWLYHERMRYQCVPRSHEHISGTHVRLIGCAQSGHHVSGGNRCLFLPGWPRVGLLKTHRHKNNVNTVSECAFIAYLL